MKVSSVERLRSRQSRFRIRFDEGEPIVLSEDLLLRFGLAAGDPVSEDMRAAMTEASESESANQIAYRYISYRPRSQHEIVQHLRRKGITKRRAEQTLLDLVRLRLVDDEEFAAMIVRDAIARGRTGPAGLRQKLREKGISRESIDRLLEEHFGDELQRQQAVDLLRKRIERTATRLGKLEPAQRKARLYQYLRQRGFSSQTAVYALNAIEV